MDHEAYIIDADGFDSSGFTIGDLRDGTEARVEEYEIYDNRVYVFSLQKGWGHPTGDRNLLNAIYDHEVCLIDTV